MSYHIIQHPTHVSTKHHVDILFLQLSLTLHMLMYIVQLGLRHTVRSS